MSDPNEFIAEDYHVLVARAQESEVKAAEAAWRDERARAAELRRQAEISAHMNSTELIQLLLDDDPVKLQERLDAEMTQMQNEANAAAAAKEKPDELPLDRFPPPPSKPILDL